MLTTIRYRTTVIHMMNSRAKIATEIKVAMTRAGVTQTALASLITMSRASLSDSLNGKRAFDTDELLEIGQALGADPLVFLLGASEPAVAS